jgi:AcrR family transcriptional regulator
MASPAPIKPVPLHPNDWILAGFARLSAQGIDAVRVEVLARDLAVSKGSFYWHFHDREDLLAKMLSRWEADETEWLEQVTANSSSVAARWAQFVERSSNVEIGRLEVAIRAWARRDHAVAARTSAIEKGKAQFIAGILRDIGFASDAAGYWSEIVLLACLGWIDRSTRAAEFQSPNATLGEFLSELILAASARSATPGR